jgi:DNA-binding transcriptional LysR family regulator
MAKLPDFEGLAIFAKVVELRSFARAAEDLKLSKATVSKAVSRIEVKLGTRLFNRTSRRLALTDTGKRLADRAAHILAEGEAAESEGLAESVAPRGLVRLAAPMSFGILHVAPLLPEFLAAWPDVSIDLHLSDAMVDMIGEGFDAAIRIAALPDSSLVARRLCAMMPYLVGAQAYFEKRGKPKHPLQLAEHACIAYAYQLTADTWHFQKKSGEQATVRPAGPLRVNNGEAMLPAILAGVGLGVLPDFIVRDAIADGRLEILFPEWSLPAGAVHWVTPPGGPKPKRLELLGDFIASRLVRRDDKPLAPPSSKRRAR